MSSSEATLQVWASPESGARRHTVGIYAAVGFVVMHAIGILVLSSGTDRARFWSDLCWTGASLAAALQFFRVVKLSPPPLRRGWLLFGIGLLSWFLAMLWWSFREVVENVSAPVFELASSAFSLMPILFVFGLPAFRAREADARHTREGLLDGLSAFLFVVLIWLSLLDGSIPRSSWDRLDIVPVAMRGAFYSAALVSGVVLFARPMTLTPQVARLLLAGLATLTGNYFEFVTTTLLRGYRTGCMADVFWTLSFALLFLAADRQLVFIRENRAPPVTRLAAPMVFVWGLVLLSVAVGLLSHGVLATASVLLLMAFAISALMAVRADRLIARERRAKEESLAVLRMREEFLAITAHELRTPLAPMQMHLSMLTRKIPELHAPEAERKRLGANAAGLQRSLDRLNRLVEHVVEVSQLERGFAWADREEVDISGLVRATIEALHEIVVRNGSELQIDIQPGVHAWIERHAIEQVVTELLTNASTFGAGKPIEVRLRDDMGRVTLAVRDRGIGIAREDQERIFGRLERAVPIGHYGGLGLGLFLARGIVEAHGGTLVVASEPGAGATFTMDLPCTLPPRTGSERAQG